MTRCHEGRRVAGGIGFIGFVAFDLSDCEKCHDVKGDVPRRRTYESRQAAKSHVLALEVDLDPQAIRKAPSR